MRINFPRHKSLTAMIQLSHCRTAFSEKLLHAKPVRFFHKKKKYSRANSVQGRHDFLVLLHENKIIRTGPSRITITPTLESTNGDILSGIGYVIHTRIAPGLLSSR